MERSLGIHHITAIASDPAANYDFHVRFLGLRLVKKTVNFDDPTTYHLYYGDYKGQPGTIMTYFPWPGAPRVKTGAGQATVVSYAVPAGSLDFWQDRAQEFGYYTEALTPRYTDTGLALRDPDGILIELIEDGEAGSSREGIPGEAAIKGFFGTTLLLHDTAATAQLLTQQMGFEEIGVDGARTRYRALSSPGQYVDLVQAPQTPRGEMGAGAIHHVAFRATSDDAQLEWQEGLIKAGMHVTEVRDRNYFHSIYFREPGGVLFEIATDPPGFTADEPLETLGHALKLPEWLEPKRDQLQAVLPALTED